MSNRINFYARALQAVYVFLFIIFLLNAFTVDVLFAPPALAILRVPSNIRGIGEIINAPWMQSLRVYHVFLLIIAVLGSLNLIGLTRLESRIWKGVLRFSSFLGILILWSLILFFFLPFLIQGNYSPVYLKTSIIYLGITFIIFLVNLATFTVAIQGRN
ncbi:MAG: hypothetical protein A2629_00415 [Candidatus Levybacteria bacterium RIFCSPHIGHO2_01_FULL_41_15]|nr:MAG: hypothetical protein A2629_00415 [Candidatus Levybacteria bacterium RIFCSPHIGHO2_01_FULL_41_15]